MRVCEPTPGTQVNMFYPGADLGPATFIARTEHPLWPHLQLVVWRMPAGHPIGTWSHDALHAQQAVGAVLPSTAEKREVNLRAALLGGGE